MKLKLYESSAIAMLLSCLICGPAFAQDAFTDPPNSGAAGGNSATGLYSTDKVESVNPITGNMSLSIPLAHLPPGPGGFSAGVSLIYNSSIYDLSTQVPADHPNFLQMAYMPSTHGGGWNYSFNYTLWSQNRITAFTYYDTCGAVSQNEAQNWYKTVLSTPDGSNHVLRLVGELDSNGNPIFGPYSTDASQSFTEYDFAGYVNANCRWYNGDQYPSRFLGTFVYATSDSTFIRLEANTVTNTWIAYLPNGTTITGTIDTTNEPHAADSDATQITDRNGNTLTISPNCSPGGGCTKTLTDGQGRQITIDFGTSGTSWNDSILWNGPNNSNLTSQVFWGTAPLYALPYYCEANPSTPSNSVTCNISQNLTVVSSISLPPASSGGTSTNFTAYYGPPTGGTYSWGELHALTMCTGAIPQTTPPTQPDPSSNCQAQWTTLYKYYFDSSNTLPSSADATRLPGTLANPIKTKTLQHNDTLQGNVTQLSDTTFYSAVLPSGAYSYPVVSSGTQQFSQVQYPDGSQSTFYTTNFCPNSNTARDLCLALPYEVFNPDGSTTEMQWVSNSVPAYGVPSGTLFNPYVSNRVYTPSGGGVVKITSLQQDQNGNTSSVQEYDWQSPSVISRTSGVITSVCTSGCSGPARTTTSAFYGSGSSYWVHGSPTNIRNPQSVKVGLTSTNYITSSAYSYDNELTTGNLTRMTGTNNTSGLSSTTSWSYLSNGNLQSTTDGNGYSTVVCYDNLNLYPISAVTAATNTSCPATPSSVSETSTLVFDSPSGTLISQADQNGATSYTYDNLGRTTSQTQTGGSLTRTTYTQYDDVNLTTKTTYSNSSVSLMTYYNALGQVQETRDAAGNQIQKAYRYGTGGVSYELTSNPYLSTSDQTMGWTLITRNATNNTVTSTNYPGGAAPSPIGSSSASSTGQRSVQTNVPPPAGVAGCGGMATKITDEAQLVHWNCQDGLGRMTAVIEPDLSVTNYSYDLLNKLTAVSSGGQTTAGCPSGILRCFSYDSALSQVTSSTNPENGTTCIGVMTGNACDGSGYDGNGNVKKITDAQGVLTQLTYDPLNRLTGKTYTIPSGQANPTAPTSNVSYAYDQGGYRGAMSSVSSVCSQNCTGVPSPITETFSYDAFGRVINSTQQVGSGATTYSFGTSGPGYQYSVTDQLTQIVYPSGRTLNYTFDSADRVLSVKNGATGTSYASVNYTTSPNNTLTTAMGNGVSEQPSFNDRIQPTGLQVNSTPAGGSVLSLGLYPCPSAQTYCQNGNNGNLQSQTISIPGLSVTQTYGYDQLNRLTSAAENAGSNVNWAQSYSYQGNGNMWISNNTGSPAAVPITPETPQSDVYTPSPVPNRVNSWTYDLNGNVQVIPIVSPNSFRSFTYDAENRQATATIVDNGSTMSATYVYDGLGQRVAKTVSGQTTTYVYDAFGNLAAEYGSSSPNPCDTATCYVTVDHLGTTRMVTDANGLVVNTDGSIAGSRYDYLPFGSQIFANYGGRTAAMGYYTMGTPDGMNPKFTGQMRDQETTLDWFNVRHMSGAQGRFQSVDPGNAGADPSDPQTWNMYAYVGNNPLSYTDPSGMCPWCLIAMGAEGGFGISGIAVAVGIGIADLVSLLDHNSPPPLANSPFPNQAPTSIPSGGPLDPGDGDPWNEQAPSGGSGSGFNTGGLFGSGNTNPFVFSFQDSGSGLANVPAIPSWIVNGIAGAGDKFSFGLTAAIRKHTPGGDATNPNTTSYTVGGWLGTGFQIFVGSAVGGTAAAVADGKNGVYFGRGTQTVFNSGKVRFGWNWVGPAKGGRDVIRLGIGPARGTSWWSHWNFWFPKAP